MRITFDSNDSIEQVVRTVSAVYGVTVSVDSPAAAATPALVARRSTAKPSARAAAKPVRPRVSSRSKAAASPAEIRRWAAANGHEVNGRGRVSQTVVAAYRAANGR
jgi:Lsr2